MTKFNYKKWVSDHKNGKLLFEQATTGSTCYACVGGQLISTSSLTYGLMDSGYLAGYAGAAGSDYCGTVSNLPTTPNYGFFFTSMAGLTALSGSCGSPTGSIQYYCSGSSCSTTPPTGQGGGAVYYDLQTCQNNCPPIPPGPPTASCHASRWPNHQNWVSTWTNNNAFNSSNPNQPCNHICQKIQQWTNMGSGTIPLGPNQNNIVQCKLAEGQNQNTIHGCNC